VNSTDDGSNPDAESDPPASDFKTTLDLVERELWVP